MRTVINKNKIHDYGADFDIDYGWGNGYVILDEWHPWFGMDYDEIPVHIHGGLTLGRYISEFDTTWCTDIKDSEIGKYLIGFDTCHYGDNLANWSKEDVQKEANRLLIQCANAVNNKTKYE